MTDLRTAINAVVKEWEHLLSEDASGTDGFAQWALNSNIEALRQALQAEPEPSIDALIAEIESIPTYTNLYPPFPDNAPPCDKLVQKSLLDEITDKYRGQK